jgi:hypothetical protein
MQHVATHRSTEMAGSDAISDASTVSEKGISRWLAPLVSFQDATLHSGWLSRIILQLWGNRTLFNMNAPIWQAFIGLLNSPKSKSWSIGGIGHGVGCYSIVLNCKYEFNGICNAGPEHHRSANWSKSWVLPIYCEDMAAPQQAGFSDIPSYSIYINLCPFIVICVAVSIQWNSHSCPFFRHIIHC